MLAGLVWIVYPTSSCIFVFTLYLVWGAYSTSSIQFPFPIKTSSCCALDLDYWMTIDMADQFSSTIFYKDHGTTGTTIEWHSRELPLCPIQELPLAADCESDSASDEEILFREERSGEVREDEPSGANPSQAGSLEKVGIKWTLKWMEYHWATCIYIYIYILSFFVWDMIDIMGICCGI